MILSKKSRKNQGMKSIYFVVVEIEIPHRVTQILAHYLILKSQLVTCSMSASNEGGFMLLTSQDSSVFNINQ